jgi:NAD(P)-dependent dehydrogenase (short-subunit alcohol dehydrogenase family)
MATPEGPEESDMAPHGPSGAGALVVTGGGRGIGAQVAFKAAQAGMPVAVIYRSRADDAARVVDAIKAAGGRAIAIAADIGKEDDVLRAFAAVDEAFGRLGGLVNNAVDAGAPTRFAELSLDAIEAVFRSNLFGAMLCAREAVKRLSTRQGGGGGAIVSLSSAIAVKTGAAGWVHFAASKAALETVSLGLAREVAAEGVRVNVVRAGVIATETRLAQRKDFLDRAVAQIPMARIGDPAEVAAAVLWLLSADAAYVTGATLDVTGGI